MRRRQGRGLSAPWQEYVEPRGPFTYESPVVVLTDRWSASMAEGFPMGLHGMGRARVVGTPMMQLGAAVFPCLLDRTGVNVQYSGEPVYDAQDRPRWLMRPDVEVTPSPTGEDVILPAGLKELSRLTSLRG
jgi:carboxyl-terminal processing protease